MLFFPLFAFLPTLFAVVFFGFEKFDRRVGHFRAPCLSDRLAGGHPWTINGVVVVKHDGIGWIVAVVDM